MILIEEAKYINLITNINIKFFLSRSNFWLNHLPAT